MSRSNCSWYRRLVLAACCLLGIAAGASEPSHLRLSANLDRPADGYCVDIPGAGRNLRTDLPLFAHNCKPVLTADSAVQWADGERLYFPGVGKCMTAAGINARALPGTALLLRECGRNTAFFDVDALQRFTLRDDGGLVLFGTDLCVVVSAESDTTYSSADVWRPLYLDRCGGVPPERRSWIMRVPSP